MKGKFMERGNLSFYEKIKFLEESKLQVSAKLYNYFVKNDLKQILDYAAELAKTNKKFDFYFSDYVASYCKNLDDLNKLQCVRDFFSKYGLIQIYPDFYPLRTNFTTKKDLAFTDVYDAYTCELNSILELKKDIENLQR